MKAARIHAFGGPEKIEIEEVPRPKLKPKHALVRVMAASAKTPKASPKTASPTRNVVRDPGAILSMTPAKSSPKVSGRRSIPLGL